MNVKTLDFIKGGANVAYLALQYYFMQFIFVLLT